MTAGAGSMYPATEAGPAKVKRSLEQCIRPEEPALRRSQEARLKQSPLVPLRISFICSSSKQAKEPCRYSNVVRRVSTSVNTARVRSRLAARSASHASRRILSGQHFRRQTQGSGSQAAVPAPEPSWREAQASPAPRVDGQFHLPVQGGHGSLPTALSRFLIASSLSLTLWSRG